MIGPDDLARWTRGAGLASATVYLIPLAGQAHVVALDDGRAIYPASMIKTPLAVATAAAVDAGRLAWLDRIAVDTANMTVNDAASPLVPGYAATLEELVELMLSRSDNVATNLLIDVVGRDDATRDLATLGFSQTAVRRKLSGALPLIDDPAATGRNAHPAHEAADLFARIARDDVPGAARIRAHLADQYWNGKLSTALHDGDRFAHKTGDTDAVSHDGGILTLANGARYVLVVYSEIASNPANDARFGAFMGSLRPHLSAHED